MSNLSVRLFQFGFMAVTTLVILGAQSGCELPEGRTVFLRDVENDYLRIAEIPDDGATLWFPNTVNTKHGKRHIEEVRGDCEAIFYRILSLQKVPGRYRLLVESKDDEAYVVQFVPNDRPMSIPTEVADRLGLEVVRERRQTSAYLIRKNAEPADGLKTYSGSPQWPELRIPREVGKLKLSYEKRKFANGGVFSSSREDDDTIFFDGISFDEFAQFVEDDIRRPVVDETGAVGYYSFVLKDHGWSRFEKNKPKILPALGVSIVPGTVETEMIIVRDKVR